MKLKFVAAAVAVMLSQGAMAQGMPQACPDVAQLQTVGVTMAMQDQTQQGTWFGITPNNTFGTNDEWTFVAGPVTSQSQQGVVESINQKLTTLSQGMGPLQSDDGTMYGCIYLNQANDFVGVTVTPPVALDSAMKFMRQARRK